MSKWDKIKVRILPNLLTAVVKLAFCDCHWNSISAVPNLAINKFRITVGIDIEGL